MSRRKDKCWRVIIERGPIRLRGIKDPTTYEIPYTVYAPTARAAERVVIRAGHGKPIRTELKEDNG